MADSVVFVIEIPMMISMKQTTLSAMIWEGNFKSKQELEICGAVLHQIIAF